LSRIQSESNIREPNKLVGTFLVPNRTLDKWTYSSPAPEAFVQVLI
jgi:hypothetical protein